MCRSGLCAHHPTSSALTARNMLKSHFVAVATETGRCHVLLARLLAWCKARSHIVHLPTAMLWSRLPQVCIACVHSCMRVCHTLSHKRTHIFIYTHTHACTHTHTHTHTHTLTGSGGMGGGKGAAPVQAHHDPYMHTRTHTNTPSHNDAPGRPTVVAEPGANGAKEQTNGAISIPSHGIRNPVTILKSHVATRFNVSCYRVAKMCRIPYLYRSFSAKEPYD